MYVMFRLITLIMISLLMQSVAAVAEMSNAETQGSVGSGLANLPPAYTEWPEQPTHIDVVPPPPLGPYQSTGLSDTGRSEQGDRKLMPSPLLKNMPWPERRRPPQPQWLPDRGQFSYAPGNAADVPGLMRSGQEPSYGNQRPWRSPMWQPMYQRPPQTRYR